MKLIIDISEELYAKVPKLINTGNMWVGDVLEAVKKATPLETQSAEADEAEWVEVDPLGTGDKAYMCSKCETGDWSITIHEYKYCPYCGRRMKNGGKRYEVSD